MVEAIVRDQKRIFPVCAWLTGQYGLNNLDMVAPVNFGRHGIESIIELHLNEAEMALVNDSAKAVREVMDVLDGMKAS
jgi:malate dehydrogenase